MTARRLLALLGAAALIAAAGCGGSGSAATSGSGGTTAAGGDRPDLTVSAAASLTSAFTKYGEQFKPASVKLSFAGSDELAAQIQQGVKPDVFASANTKLPDMLFAKGLVAKPTVFTSNRLTIAVPAGSTKVRSVADLAKPGIKIAIGSPTVPIGAYTRKVLARLPDAEEHAILDNVRSNEPDVKGVIAKVTEKAVDAGFVYATDVTATSGKAESVDLPDRVQPDVAYGIAVVKGAKHPTQARAFIAGVTHGQGQRDLREAGFLPPPR